MGYPGWQIAKWNKQRAENAPPYKQMKDRNMKDVEVVFTSAVIQNKRYYYFKEIRQPSNKITMTYIANLGGRKGVNKYWTWHGYGGWISYVTFDEEEFNRMKVEVIRLGGSVKIQNSKSLKEEEK